jgi:hypothetical protein
MIPIGILACVHDWRQKRISIETCRDLLYGLPFFLFLMLTNTTIMWYILPVIPGAALLVVYPVARLRNRTLRGLGLVLCLVAGVFVLGTRESRSGRPYRTDTPTYRTAVQAKRDCTSLHVLLDRSARERIAALERDEELLSTSLTYGLNPAMIYYFGEPIEFSRDVSSTIRSVAAASEGNCFVLDARDREPVTADDRLAPIGRHGDLGLYRVEASR